MIQCFSEYLGCFITLTEWEINGKKCTCLTMQSDFIVQKISRNMAKMNMCELHRHEKVKEYGYVKVCTIPSRKSPEFWTQKGSAKDSAYSYEFLC